MAEVAWTWQDMNPQPSDEQLSYLTTVLQTQPGGPLHPMDEKAQNT